MLGLSGLYTRLHLAPRMIRRDGIILLLAIGLFTLVSIDSRILRAEGALLILAYAIYLVALVQAERRGKDTPKKPSKRRAIVDFATVALGMATVVVAAHVVVTRAVSIAEAWNVSQTVIGIFLVGAGTSLPEMAVSVRAALKGQASISVGNVIGSNTFDLMVPLGVSSTLFPLAVSRDTLVIDVPVMMVVTMVTLIFFLWRKSLQKGEAASLLLMYVGYLVVRVFVI